MVRLLPFGCAQDRLAPLLAMTFRHHLFYVNGYISCCIDSLIPNGLELSGQDGCEAGGLIRFNELLGGASFLFSAFDGEPSLLLFFTCIEFRVPNTFQYVSKFFNA